MTSDEEVALTSEEEPGQIVLTDEETYYRQMNEETDCQDENEYEEEYEYEEEEEDHEYA